MTTQTRAKAAPEPKAAVDPLLTMLGKRATRVSFNLWLVGDTPLIVHAWTQKAKLEMLAKQTKLVVSAKEARNPDTDFTNSLYRHPTGYYGFPLMAFKNCIVAMAHKDKGIAKTDVQRSLFLQGEMIRAYTAHAAAICDMPIVRLYGSEPEMREDMGKIGKGLNKTAGLIYRAQFTTWAVKLVGRLNPNVIPLAALEFLIKEAGESCGVGDWRNEKSGIFGSFHLAGNDEAKAWDTFAFGKGKLPVHQAVSSRLT